jgi:CheY-like chemotaxis protein
VPLVLAIEPDQRQASILKRIVRDKVHADVAVVDSPDAALAAIGTRLPDVLLLSALLSPRDEDELIVHLRGLDGADHIQTHTIPQLASTAADQEPGARGKGLLGVFKRKKDSAQPIVAGCDPDLFADEIITFLQRAAEKKAENVAVLQSRVDRLEYQIQSSAQPETQAAPPPAAESQEERPGAAAESSWSSPFEWRKSPPPKAPSAEPVASTPEPGVPAPEAVIPGPEFAPIGDEAIIVDEPYAARDDLFAPTIETSASSVEPIADSPRNDADPAGADTPIYTDLLPQETEIAVPLEAAPGRDTDRPSKRRRNTIAPATLLRLTPLAMWARTEAEQRAPKSSQAAEPKTAADELRNLMANLAVPPHVAGVSYGRGCRIRRVRVLGGKERRRADAPGPVILSRRTLERQREASQ